MNADSDKSLTGKEMQVRSKTLVTGVALCCASFAVAGNKTDYPKERIAEFVIEKLDVTSLPSAFRPKKEKGKRTFADYGFTTRSVGENEAIVEAASGLRRLAIKILDQKWSGIYVCVAEPGQNEAETKMQSVVLLKRKNSTALLKGRESFREFAACPLIGGSNSTVDSNGGD
jgi:hypothetical protein